MANFDIEIELAEQANGVMVTTLADERAKHNNEALQITNAKLEPIFGPDVVEMQPVTVRGPVIGHRVKFSVE